MWQLFDIAYVIPAAVFIGYWIGRYLEDHYDGKYFINSILIGATCGLILTIFKIKRFVDEQNKEEKQQNKSPQDSESQ